MATIKEYDNEEELVKLNDNLKKIKKMDLTSTKDIIPLKNIFKDINNCITYITTKKFVEKFIEEFQLGSYLEIVEKIADKIRKTNPSANGYDFEFEAKTDTEIKVIAEVKCNIPVNGELGFGSSQEDAILKDLGHLAVPETKKAQKGEKTNYSDYYKFMVFLDCDDNTSSAVDKICTKWNKKKTFKLNDETYPRTIRAEKIEDWNTAKSKKDVIHVVIIDPD